MTLTEIYSEKSRQIVYDYLRETRIATRDWLLRLEGEEEEREEWGKRLDCSAVRM